MTIIPHPVLTPKGSDYKGGSFDSEIEGQPERTADGNIILTISFNLASEFMWNMIEEKTARICVLVKCIKTHKRHVRLADVSHRKAKVRLDMKNSDYIDKITITPYIYAARELNNFKSDEHHEEFSGVVMNIPSGAIIAMGGMHELKIDSLKTISAAIQIITHPEIKEDGKYTIDLDNDYIHIGMNSETVRKVKNLRKTPKCLNLFPTLYLSAITHAIMNVNNDDLTDKKWRGALEKSLAKCAPNNEEYHEKPYKFAQLLLQNPLNHILMEEDNFE